MVLSILLEKCQTNFLKVIVGTAYISYECEIPKYSTRTIVAEMLAMRCPDYELLLCGKYKLPIIICQLNKHLRFLADTEALQSVIDKAACMNDSFVLWIKTISSCSC